MRAGRKADAVKVVVVGKKQPAERINELLSAFPNDHIILGESYVQECKRKIPELASRPMIHMIGPLQRNKAKEAVKLFDVIQSAHSLEILQAIDDAAKSLGKIQAVMMQVNVSRDLGKSGFDESDFDLALENVQKLANLSLVGLMTITRMYEEAEMARSDFQKLKLLEARASSLLERELEISMGMSSDFEVAIEEGATLVRIGSAIFGERPDS